jgi:phosphatidylinositol-3-phosphatase
MTRLYWLLCATLFLVGSPILHAQSENPAALPLPAHVVVVMEENHSYSEIIGNSQAPYINTLASEGALFTSSYAVAHPSEPNYLAIFSGSTHGVTSDACPLTFNTANLGYELIASGKTFTGYSEGLPSVGSKVCTSGEYARKHVPWTDFTDLAPTVNQPFSAFPTNYANLPMISFVIPDLLDDMHDGTIQQGDTWLEHNLSGYVNWAKTNNSLLIITWDEDDGSAGNRIPTIFVGPMVKPGKYSEKIYHYSVLRTLEAMYGVPYLGKAALVTTITDCWQ